MKLIERLEGWEKSREEMYQELWENPIDLDALYMAVVKSVHYDYVGFEAKRDYFMPGEHHTYIMSHMRYNKLTMEMLVRSFHQFIGDMHDRHLRFLADDWIDYRNLAMKYRVRAYGEYLYVTEAAPETGLVPGDKIITIQRMTPERVRGYLRRVAFYSDVPERELWGGYLRMAQSLEVEHADGSREKKRMELYPASEAGEVEYPIEFAMPDEKISYIKLERMDTEAVEQLLAEHGAQIARSEKLILDLRRNVGGDEDACLGLLPYLVDREYRLSELYHDEGSYVLFTKNNCERRYATLQAYKETLTDPEEIALIQEEMELYRANYGKGLMYQPPMEWEEDPVIGPAAQAPSKVVIVTDTFCEDEGEQFVAMAQRCGSKVVVIGRPTMGTLDYYDCIHLAVHEHMILSYPIRMTKAAYEGRGISEKGLSVDEYIAWTPEEIQRDVLLLRAMEL